MSEIVFEKFVVKMCLLLGLSAHPMCAIYYSQTNLSLVSYCTSYLGDAGPQ